jgi:CDP-glycerol glycerophosphotransferase (TagB/SpsB family)
MKKIIYVITSLSHKRVFESFVERDDIEQMIAGPYPKITSNIVPEDYSDFKIKNIKFYNNIIELQNIINKYNPSIYVEASLPIAKDIVLPNICKKVYISHGMIGDHVGSIVKQGGFDTSVWQGCDLYCGATDVFSNWIKQVTNADDSSIFLNAIPQFDILYNSNYYNSYKQKVLQKTKNPQASKIILFVGFCCKNRTDFKLHNEDYFKTAIELEKIARKNNWLIMIKPRQTHDVMMQFLKNQKWGSKYIKDYEALNNSKYIHFITTTGHIYRYLFADLIVINGTSTVEVETCAIQKPLFIVRTQIDCNNTYDPYNMINSGAGSGINKLNELELFLHEYFDDGAHHNPELQQKWFTDRNITLDGKMYKRIQDKLLDL